MNSPNAYAKLISHFEKHQYKRGAYMHSAPLDPSRRWATSKRVVPTSGHVHVICHRTPVLTVSPDGTITLNTNGYRTNTTRDTINAALGLLRLPNAPHIHSRRLFGLSQWCITTRTPTDDPLNPYLRTTYAFYDNITLSPDTHQPIEPRPFDARRIDTTQSRPFTAQSREFFRTLPVLYAAATVSADEAHQAYYTHRLYEPTTLRRVLTSQPELWPAVATWLAYRTGTLPEAKRTLAAMVRADLYRTVPTTTTTV